MLLDTTIPLSRAWNTWSDRPAEMVFLPLGLRLTPVVFSAREGKASLLPAAALRFDAHSPDGAEISCTARHAGSELALGWRRDEPWSVLGTWARGRLAEWGQRFWLSYCISAEDGSEAEWDAEAGAAVITIGTRHLALVCREAPVEVSVHDSPQALAEDFEAHGYWHIGSRGVRGRALGLRFNLEMMPEGALAAAVADSRERAIAAARARLARAEAPAAPRPVQEGPFAGALEAVADVIGWNTVWDPVNRRPYTSVSRLWPLGAFAVWFNDQTYAALMSGLFEPGLAAENFRAALASATPQGNFATIVTSRDAWVDRTQTPMASFMLWLMHLRGAAGPDLLAEAYPALLANHMWWRRERDPDGQGLVSCGTSDVGASLYKGTHFGARNETGMDNSATHDEAVYDPRTRTLSTLDLGLNCALALDAEMLARIAAHLGESARAAELEALAAQTRALIRTRLWDPERRIFANRQRHGGFVRSLSPTSFYPLLCGAADAEQTEALRGHLADPALFAGRYGLPNTARSEPAYADNTYWRGRIWPNVNYMVWQGLRRAGLAAEADALAASSWELFAQNWAAREAGENYSAETGEVRDAPDTDPFYTWGAMLPLMAVGQVMDVTPWAGWEIRHDGTPLRLGPVTSPAGQVLLESAAGRLSLSRGEAGLLETDFRGRLGGITLAPGLFRCRLFPEVPGAAATLTLPGVRPGALIAARLAGAPLTPLTGEALSFDISAAAEGAMLEICHAPDA
ncbi:trehalase family glycosidase [Oceanicella sp. SM1341]|uniref:MGH1-like glycoside hydrolase domain-containing protein n=1 Tax=Oceanicella sp. SM1341 TaxID=1548889 RepID=UPI000E4E27EF|nr:trehalase family glycosidase [Oceanicella sp. SM1341]